MLPRKKLDIGWSDLAVAIGYCVAASGDRCVRRRLQAEWQEAANSPAIACLSVRTGFDLLLTALALPRGSEVILSAVTIRDMVRIIRQHGLIPVPVDVEMETLSVDATDAITTP